ncbi:hypothetical protein SDC9_176105 [bioreactor metagenome]|uniref:Uncharacterized protein n=1 Tax=bioreactor metagenome TaxID=1076179 RepID=A0A645GRU3_9ZZZZ
METLQQPIDCWPSQALSLTPPVEPFVQCPAGLIIEEFHTARVADDSIVIPRPLQLCLQCFHQQAQLLVTLFFDPVSYPLQGRLMLLGGRASFNPWFAFPIRFPVKLEP